MAQDFNGLDMLNELLLDSGLFKREVSRIIGVSEGALNQALRRRSALPDPSVQKIARLYKRLYGKAL